MEYRSLVSQENLELAWSRILTSTNMQYKRFFRETYLAYQVGVERRLARLSERLLGGWMPRSPHMVYLPKASGLQRPLSFLSLEDQIVLQAVANAFARKMWDRRKAVEYRATFSNILGKRRDSIFFVRDWRTTYWGFQIHSERQWRSGRRWIAHFDLAAFYDTVSHDLLLRLVSPRGGHSDTWDPVKTWLRCWSSPQDGWGFGHGIPQGPIASDFLAECFLLPLDEALLNAGVAYTRYVDDIRIFASTELEAQKAAVLLEGHCRRLGLIPQGAKFAIQEAKSVEDVLGLMPSLAPPDEGYAADEVTAPEESELLFRSALGGSPLRVEDKSTARFVLYRGAESRKILKWVSKLLRRQPEHIDAYVAYASRFSRSKPLCDEIESILRTGNPYEYLRGELWHVLARMAPPNQIQALRSLALDELRDAESVTLRWGLIAFLLRAEQEGLGKVAWRIRFQPDLVQAWMVPKIPDSEYAPQRLVPKILKDGSVPAGVGLATELLDRRLSLASLGLTEGELHTDVLTAFEALGLGGHLAAPPVDQVGELLEQRYGPMPARRWRDLLQAEYNHALSLIRKAESSFEAGRGQWLMYQNSFNDLVLRAFIQFLDNNGFPGVTTLVGRNNKIVKFGSLLDSNNPFSRRHPTVADPFRAMNTRRNRLPGAHPYDEKGGAQNSYLRRREQRGLARGLTGAFQEMMTWVAKV